MKKTVPEKANLILNLILLALLIIATRVWHLSILQHDSKIEEARRPQKKTVISPAERGTIRDRYNTLMAANKLKYRAAVVYSEIQEVPSTVFEKQADGSVKKIFKRKKYVEDLCKLIARELSLEKDYIEDLIYSKAAFLGPTPLVIKDDLDEERYYRLKALSRSFPGLRAEMTSKRFYPLCKVGCDVIGYMGAISREEYQKVLAEIRTLSEALHAHTEDDSTPLPAECYSWKEAEKKLKSLQDKAYTINDRVGKAGVEASFDQILKGRIGKKFYLFDRKGTLLRPLPGSKDPISGERLHLCLSAELQKFAEELLIDNEERREGRSFRFDSETMRFEKIEEPWIKGGAIVAMDPQTGEIVAMASYPRFDPNDFVPSRDPKIQALKKERVQNALENEDHIASLWDQREALRREKIDGKELFEEKLMITWHGFLTLSLPHEDPIISQLERFGTIAHSLKLQRTVYQICRDTGLSEKEVVTNYEEFPELTSYFSNLKEASDRLLFADLLRLLVAEELFTEEASASFGALTLDEYKDLSAKYKNLERLLKKKLRKAFRNTVFAKWREKNQQSFLKEKRAWEKKEGLISKPYLDYLQTEELKQFQQFWQEHRYQIVKKMLTNRGDTSTLGKEFSELKEALNNYSPIECIALFKTMQSFDELNSPLWGHYPYLRSFEGVRNKKSLAASFYPLTGFGYGRSFCFRQASQLGSLFKIVPAYAALMKLYEAHEELSPLTIIDSYQKSGSSYTMGTFTDGKAIPRLYKGGRLPRSEHSDVGRVNLVGALETSSNPYFSLLAIDHIESPSKLLEISSRFSFGKKTGIDLAGEISGRLPSDLEKNTTGLFSFAIGQHAFDSTPLQASVMLSTLAKKGITLKPQILKIRAGKQPSYSSQKLFNRSKYPFQKQLEAVGIDFPLFSAALSPTEESLVEINEPEVIGKVPLPSPVYKQIIDGLQQVMIGRRGTAKYSKIRTYEQNSAVMEDYKALSKRLVGKTSTAQRVERLWPAKPSGAQMVKHVWFGGLFFEDESLKKPDLIVVVYLRFGDFGREAAPLATQVYTEWCRIKAAHQGAS